MVRLNSTCLMWPKFLFTSGILCVISIAYYLVLANSGYQELKVGLKASSEYYNWAGLRRMLSPCT